MKVKALKFTKNHGFHGNGRFSRTKANFTENVTAVKSWIRLVPMYDASVRVTTFKMLAEFRQDSIPHVRQWSMYYWSQRLQCIQYMHATSATRQRMSNYNLQMNKYICHITPSLQPCDLMLLTQIHISVTFSRNWSSLSWTLSIWLCK